METFVGQVTDDSEACARENSQCELASLVGPMLRRLSRTEYDRTIAELLGMKRLGDELPVR